MPTYPLTGFNGSELTLVPRDKLRSAHIALVTAIGFAVPHRVVYTPDSADYEAFRDHWLDIAKALSDYAETFLDEVAQHSPECINHEFSNQLTDVFDTIFSQLERARDRSMQVDPLTGEPV